MADLFLFDNRHTGAEFSPCRTWRYRLWRYWDPEAVWRGARAVFVLMNPSTADEVLDDPTVDRQQERVRRWPAMGLPMVGGIDVLNVFAVRETDSTKLPALAQRMDIIGPRNDLALATVCRGAAMVVCGWGVPGHQLLGRGPKVLQLLRSVGVQPYALKVNEDGSPCHPLYLRYDLAPTPL